MTIDIQRNIKNLAKLGEWFISAWLREIYNYEDKENKNFIKYIDLVMHLDLYTTSPFPIIVGTHGLTLMRIKMSQTKGTST